VPARTESLTGPLVLWAGSDGPSGQTRVNRSVVIGVHGPADLEAPTSPSALTFLKYNEDVSETHLRLYQRHDVSTCGRERAQRFFWKVLYPVSWQALSLGLPG
jgi:hypothetical protein